MRERVVGGDDPVPPRVRHEDCLGHVPVAAGVVLLLEIDLAEATPDGAVVVVLEAELLPADEESDVEGREVGGALAEAGGLAVVAAVAAAAAING